MTPSACYWWLDNCWQPDPRQGNQKVSPEHLELKSRAWEERSSLCGCPCVSIRTGYIVRTPKVTTEVSFFLRSIHHRMVNRLYVAAATEGHRLLGQTSFKCCHHLTKGKSEVLEHLTQEINCSAGSDTAFSSKLIGQNYSHPLGPSLPPLSTPEL